MPLLQMHDCLDCSVSSREQAELVARLGCEAVQLDVPMRVDLKYGRSWGDAKHTWEELHRTAASAAVEDVGDLPTPVIAGDDEEDAADAEEIENVEDDEQADLDEINAALQREGIEPIALSAAAAPPWEEPAPITQADIDEINAGLAREGIELISGGSHAGHERVAAAGEVSGSPTDGAEDPANQAPKLNGQGADAAGVYVGQSRGSDGPADDHKIRPATPRPPVAARLIRSIYIRTRRVKTITARSGRPPRNSGKKSGTARVGAKAALTFDTSITFAR